MGSGACCPDAKLVELRRVNEKQKGEKSGSEPGGHMSVKGKGGRAYKRCKKRGPKIKPNKQTTGI